MPAELPRLPGRGDPAARATAPAGSTTSSGSHASARSAGPAGSTGPSGSTSPVGSVPAVAPATATRAEYQAWLDDLDDELIGGAMQVADALPRTCRAALHGDPHVADEARALRNAIRDRCRYLDEQSFLLLAREAPVSGDLRRLMAIVRLVPDLERSAVLLQHVGTSVERVEVADFPEDVQRRLEDLASRAIDVFRQGIDAWRRRDGLAVHDVNRADGDVDRQAIGLAVRARNLPPDSGDLLGLGLLVRYLERLADHGVAFAQQSSFVVTGTRVELV